MERLNAHAEPLSMGSRSAVRRAAPAPRGLSLLELAAALAITASLGAACMSLLSTVQASWVQHRQEMAVREQALAALAHVVRNGRQASAVTEASPGALRLLVADGPDDLVERSWSYNAATQQLIYQDAAGSEVIAENVLEFAVEGRGADAVATAADPSEVRCVVCTLEYEIPRPDGAVAESMTSQVWLRSW
jgi:type II secretory pathway pseudopilin PulG